MSGMPRPKIEDGKTASERYEASGQRPGTPIGTRLSEADMRAVDRARGAGTRREISRSAWLLNTIRAAIGRQSRED